MGQSRTALVLGIVPGPELHDLLTSDKAEKIMDSRDAPEWLDSGLLGIAFACAYDDSHDCAEIEFPVSLSEAASAYPEHYRKALAKWDRFAGAVMDTFRHLIPQPIIFLDEVERA